MKIPPGVPILDSAAATTPSAHSALVPFPPFPVLTSQDFEVATGGVIPEIKGLPAIEGALSSNNFFPMAGFPCEDVSRPATDPTPSEKNIACVKREMRLDDIRIGHYEGGFRIFPRVYFWDEPGCRVTCATELRAGQSPKEVAALLRDWADRIENISSATADNNFSGSAGPCGVTQSESSLDAAPTIDFTCGGKAEGLDAPRPDQRPAMIRAGAAEPFGTAFMQEASTVPASESSDSPCENDLDSNATAGTSEAGAKPGTARHTEGKLSAGESPAESTPVQPLADRADENKKIVCRDFKPDQAWLRAQIEKLQTALDDICGYACTVRTDRLNNDGEMALQTLDWCVGLLEQVQEGRKILEESKLSGPLNVIESEGNPALVIPGRAL